MFYVNKAFLFKFVFVNLPHCDGQKKGGSSRAGNHGSDSLTATLSNVPSVCVWGGGGRSGSPYFITPYGAIKVGHKMLGLNTEIKNFSFSE